MGAGCSHTSTHVEGTYRGKPPSQSSVRLLGALGGLGKPSTSATQTQEEHNQVTEEQHDKLGKPDLHEQIFKSTKPPQVDDLKTDEPYLLTPGLEIHPLPDKPLLRQRQTIPPMDLDSTVTVDDPNAPTADAQNTTETLTNNNHTDNGSDHSSLNNSQSKMHSDNVQLESGRDNGNGVGSDEQDEPLPCITENRRRSNSISILPSIEPKSKFPSGSNGIEGKKSDPDLVMWISNKLKTKLKLARISKAYDRFIPSNFYSEMGKQDIREVDLGECVIVRKSILFCDIRNFTAFSSKIGPQDTFKFINAFSRRLLPVVRKYGGYIDKFIGDALVALFPSATQGIWAGSEILRALEGYNEARIAKSLLPVRVGIGCHTGTLMLGTVGDSQRMDGIAIGNVISLASQVEVSTKLFGVDFITTRVTMLGLKEEDKNTFVFRRLGRIKEGTEDDQLTDIFQVCSADSPVASILNRFEEGVNLFQQKDFAAAVDVFRECVAQVPQDKPSLVLENRALHFQACTYLPADWGNGLTYHTEHMTQSTGADELGGSPSAPTAKDFPTAMTGNANLCLMRLVFSAIFHMHSVSMKKHPDLSSDDEGDTEEECESPEADQDVIPEVTMINPDVHVNSRVTLPPIISTGKTVNGEPASGKRKLPTEKKEKELITLVLSGFENHNRVSYLTKAYQRFVPNDFLSYLGKEDVEHVDIGDSMMTNITTMFIEIHGFQPKNKAISDKTLSQLQGMKRFTDPPPPSSPPPNSLSTSRNTLQPTDARKLTHSVSRNTFALRADLFSFQFLNTISQKLLPIIRQCDGYVDKFFGNAILALFPSLDAATRAGLQIMAAVKDFGAVNDEGEDHPAYAQIGMNSGNVILGTVGDGKRMDGTVIGNTVNVAARMLSLTKVFGVKFVTTSRCIAQLSDPVQPSSPPMHTPPNSPPKESLPKRSGSYKFYNQRLLDVVRVPGKEESIIVHEIFDNESQVAQIKATYEAGVALYQARKFAEAQKQFEEALLVHPLDVPSQMFLDKCTKFLREGVPPGWDGVTVVSVK